MVVNIPTTLIDKNCPSVVPVSEAVFVINLESGAVFAFAKDVNVIKVFATFQYIS
jgi:hypothetical protein